MVRTGPSAGKPSAWAASSNISIGVSQMPIRRASVSWCTACVTMLTGLEKLISHARGARCATSRRSSTIAGGADAHREADRANRLLADGVERDDRGFVPGTLRGAADADAADDERRAVHRGLGRGKRGDPGIGAICDARPAITRCQSTSVSNSAMSVMRKSERASPPTSRGTRTPAPPMIAIFKCRLPVAWIVRPPCSRARDTGLVPCRASTPPGNRR